MKIAGFVLPVVLALMSGCVGPGQPPHAILPPITQEYFVCRKCGSLHGGIYGKGPLLSLEQGAGASCWHQWRLISRAEFQKQAEQKFPAQWSQALPFFKRSVKSEEERGYVHGPKEVSVIIEVFAMDPMPPYRGGDTGHFTAKIAPQSHFGRAVDFIPMVEFHRWAEEMKSRKLYPPDLDLMAPTRVLRGKERTMVASSGRRFEWTEGFQLEEGDVIHIQQVLD